MENELNNYSKAPVCMDGNYEVYIAGVGYKKVSDTSPGDVIINEVNGKVERIRISNIY